MARLRNQTARGGFSAGLLLGGAALLIGLPGTVLAFGGLDGRGVSLAARGSFASFTPASMTQDAARILPEKLSGKGRMMRFTPAGSSNRPDRSVTVAVRVDGETARAISVRSAIAAAQGDAGNGPGTIVLAPTRFALGVARGYRSFAPTVATPTLRRIEMPDLSTYAPSQKAAVPGRFNARVAVEDKGGSAMLAAPLDPLARTNLDVAGSYRLMNNLDVTAGLRYSEQRQRLSPLTDGRQDSQAVYVGTRFRF